MKPLVTTHIDGHDASASRLRGVTQQEGNEKMTTNLYNSKGTCLGEIEVSSIMDTGADTNMTERLRDDGMTEWFGAARLTDGRRCEVIVFFWRCSQGGRLTDALRGHSLCCSYIERVVLDSGEDEDDFAPLAADEKELVLPPVVSEVISNLVSKRVYLQELSKSANGEMVESQTLLMYYDMWEFLGFQIALLQGMQRERA